MSVIRESSLKPSLSKIEEQIATILGIQTSYKSNFKSQIYAEKKNFQGLLSALLSDDEKKLTLEELLASLEQGRSQKILQEHVVLTTGSTLSVGLNPHHLGKAPEKLEVHFTPENGEALDLTLTLKGKSYLHERELLAGVHRISVKANPEDSCLILVAPQRGKELSTQKSWGFFAPLYALHSKDSWGAGDYSDLEKFNNFAASVGAKTVATLPLLPTFLSSWKVDPSPYSPISRVFWSEFYVDPRRSIEWNLVPEAREIFEKLSGQIETLQQSEQVQYERIFELKKEILSPMADAYFKEGDPSRLQKLMQEKHDVVQYARFRAYCDIEESSWSCWPESWLRDLPPSKNTKKLEQLYLYMQLLACEQLESVARSAAAQGLNFYLDLPIGVHGDGYDVFKNNALYARALSAGAPPDPFFSLGQNWGFPPLNPRTLLSDGLKHFRQIIRHHVSHAAILRVDHVMGLHRIYVVPHGLEASEGLYISYPADLLYGAMLLEAEKTGTVIVGEDLGTVPEVVVEKMKAHNFSRLYVMQYEANPSNKNVLGIPDELSVASLNTHDMPMWQAFWDALDLDDRVERGLLNAESAKNELELRVAIRGKALKLFNSLEFLSAQKPSKQEVLMAALGWLMESRARLALVTLEDLWGELEPQNTPGTYKEKPNWCRKNSRRLEEIMDDGDLHNSLQKIARHRVANQ